MQKIEILNNKIYVTTEDYFCEIYFKNNHYYIDIFEDYWIVQDCDTIKIKREYENFSEETGKEIADKLLKNDFNFN